MDGQIKHIKEGNVGAFIYEENGKRSAEMVYTMEPGANMIIQHTEVDESLEGQGIGKKLQAALVDYVRSHNIKVEALCPFANAMFKKVKEWQNVLA